MHRVTSLIIVLGLCTAAAAAAGDLQITCEPGLRIYVDGELVGLTNAREDGLYLMDLKAGEHTVRIEKDGFFSQRFEVEIGDTPSELAPGTFIPLPKLAVTTLPDASPTPPVPLKPKKVSELTITSAPQLCTVEIDGATYIKDKPVLTIGGLSAGPHFIRFSKEGFETIGRSVEVIPSAKIKVRGNLKDGEVELVHEGEGSLRIIPKPRNCNVWFRGEFFDNIGMALKRSKIPAGEYPIRFSYRGKETSATLLIKDGCRTNVWVSFLSKDPTVKVSYELE